MRVNFKSATRLAALTLSAGLAGCATPGEPFDEKPVSASVSRQAASASPRTPTRPRSLQPTGIVQASAAVANEPTPQIFTPDEAVRFALENNPFLQAVRQQRGFAQGGVVIARTYPYNPISQLTFFGVAGEATNRFAQAYKVTLDVEI